MIEHLYYVILWTWSLKLFDCVAHNHHFLQFIYSTYFEASYYYGNLSNPTLIQLKPVKLSFGTNNRLNISIYNGLS